MNENIDALARLCVVEVRGFGERRVDGCRSILSTVMLRTMRPIYSDGSIEGTLTWGCRPGEGGDCQFPAYVVQGCNGIVPASCPWNYPDDIAYFRGVVEQFLYGTPVPGEQTCLEYLYYNSTDTTPGNCFIRASNGQFEAFHN